MEKSSPRKAQQRSGMSSEQNQTQEMDTSSPRSKQISNNNTSAENANQTDEPAKTDSVQMTFLKPPDMTLTTTKPGGNVLKRPGEPGKRGRKRIRPLSPEPEESDKDCEFVEGIDVLARWNDGLFYLGTVSKVISHQRKCLVIFEDSSEHWVLFKHIQKGRIPNGEITCCTCEGDQSEPPNEIVICDRCTQGYHQLCHQPPIDSRKLLCPDESWHCRQCVFVNSAKVGGALKKGPAAKVFQEMKQSLPYDLNSLRWDSVHKTNAEQCYCYCGGPGEWYLKMLRCCRCMQFFHEACIQCLEMPMLYGDGFYIFVCSVCNAGPEYLKRLPLKWQDLAQLVLYNLTLMHRKKYYDFEEEIIPYLTEQWYNLQVAHLGATTRSEKQERILEALENSKARFACGKEVKKKQNIWGLRIRKPPIPPTIILPAIGQITDDVMNDLKMTGRKVMTFIPVECNSPVPLKPTKRKRKNAAETPEELDRRSAKARKKYRQAVKNGTLKAPFSPNQSYLGYSGDGMSLSNLTPVTDGQSVLDTIQPFETIYSSSTGVPIPLSFSRHSSMSGDTGSDYSAATIPAGEGESETNDTGLKRHRKHGSWKRKRKYVTPTKINPIHSPKATATMAKYAKGSKMEDSNKSPPRRLNGALTMPEIKRSLSNHYGPEGRLACGEKHEVLGKRVTPDGKVQYLIQWEGVTP